MPICCCSAELLLLLLLFLSAGAVGDWTVSCFLMAMR